MSVLQSVSRVIRAVEFLAERESARLDEVAAEIDVHKSNALRLLATLRAHNWVAVDDTRTLYSIGPRLASIGRAAVAGLELHKALSLAEDLRDLTGETVHVSMPHGDKMLVVGRADSPNALKVTCDVGTEDLLHSTAVGKAYLASLSDAALEELLESLDLAPITPATLSTPEALREDVASIRERHYATNLQEARRGTSALAVALRFGPFTPVLCLSITGPAERFTRAVMGRMAPDILELVAPHQAL